ncbi:hypothetical protein JCM11641_000993 [Rhodosporidiobolus odoratus]
MRPGLRPSGQLSPAPRNPFLPVARHLSKLFTRRRTLKSHEYFDKPITVEEEAYGRSSAMVILSELLNHCDHSNAGSPSQNKTAGIDFVRHLEREAKTWSTFFRQSFFEAYLGAMKSVKAVKTFPQQERLLEHEGDVGDLVLSNVLAPILAILKKLIAPDMEEYLDIYIQHQASKTLRRFVRSKDGKMEEQTVVIYIDHAIVLVNKRCTMEDRRAKLDRVYLAIVDEKRAGFVRSGHWETPSWITSDNTVKHLNQILLYAWQFECPYVLLTDYVSGVALHVLPRHDRQRPDPPRFDVASNPYPTFKESQQLVKTPNPMDGGLRHGICILAVHAMHELRVLNYDLFPTLEV